MFATLLATAIILNPSSSYDRSMSVETCRHAEVKKPCAFKIEAPGYGSKKFKLYKKETNGDLTLLKVGIINVAGQKELSLSFESVEVFNLIAVLFDSKGNPLAISGALIDVEPAKSQLGEQYTPNLSVEDSPAESKASTKEDSYNNEPLFNDFNYIPD